MPRRARIVLAGVPLHIIQRGNNRNACFVGESDYLVYLSMLGQCAAEAKCEVHAYVLMTNHIHLLASPGDSAGAALLMKSLGERYVQYFNRRHQRTGTLWEGRFRSCLVDSESYFLACQRYIELNPVRANIAIHPGHYRWSSYRCNANGELDPIVTQHSVYRGLGRNRVSRQQSYRELFSTQLPEQAIEDIRRAASGNHALGNETFIKSIEAAVGCLVRPQKPGRHRHTQLR